MLRTVGTFLVADVAGIREGFCAEYKAVTN